MEIFALLIFIFLIFGLLGGEKKTKPETKTRRLNAGGRANEGADYPSSWKNYEQAERGEGMQDDLDPSQLYAVSKARLETAHKKAAQALSYQGLPTVKMPRAKNKGRSIKSGRDNMSAKFSPGQPPLVRDMNLQRRIFISGAGHRIFGEREKTRGGTKTLLVFVVLSVLAAYILSANFS